MLYLLMYFKSQRLMAVYKSLYRGQKHLLTQPSLGLALGLGSESCVARPLKYDSRLLTRGGSSRSRPRPTPIPPLLAYGCERQMALTTCIQAGRFGISPNNLTSTQEGIKFTDCIELSCNKAREIFEQDFNLYNEFISESETESLLKEVRKYFKGLRYESDHWDDAIHGYRETEKSKWTEENSKIIQRLRDTAFEVGCHHNTLVHVLDLAEDGYIKPHIDSVKFCGNTIAGISLLSSSVMKLVHEKQNHIWANVLLQPSSLYVLRDRVRYEFTHEILPNETSSFRGEKVYKNRRISVICRNES